MLTPGSPDTWIGQKSIKLITIHKLGSQGKQGYSDINM